MSKKIDLTGQRFNKLLVLEDDGYRGKGTGVYWKCQCDCGNITYVRSNRLKSGTTKSCGCYQKNIAKSIGKNSIKNLVGQKFGKLIVLEDSQQRKSHSIIWKCQCDCGNIAYVKGENLKTGNTKSCGCFSKESRRDRKIDLRGKQFGNLKVIKETNERKNKCVVWLCQCKCGKYIKVSSSFLRNNITLSCGCLKESSGELKVSKILLENNILFEKQKIFKECKFPDTKHYARFDFYLPNYNCLIEYDGIQHFEYKGSWWNTKEAFEERQKKDKFKNQWCKNNSINLIRIPYTHYKQLEVKDLLPDSSKFLI